MWESLFLAQKRGLVIGMRSNPKMTEKKNGDISLGYRRRKNAFDNGLHNLIGPMINNSEKNMIPAAEKR